MKKLIYSATIMGALLLGACGSDEATDTDAKETEVATTNAKEEVEEQVKEESVP